MDKISLQGTAAVDTPTLIVLVVKAEKAGYEHQLPIDVIAALEYEGTHIVCLRPDLLEGADHSGEKEDGTGVTAFETTPTMPLPCEVLTKLQGQKSPSRHMLSIQVQDYADLEQLDGPTPKPGFNAVDGQRRKFNV
jgi:hypothetical protein